MVLPQWVLKCGKLVKILTRNCRVEFKRRNLLKVLHLYLVWAGPHSNIERRRSRKIPIMQKESIQNVLHSHLLRNKFVFLPAHFVLQKWLRKAHELVVIAMAECVLAIKSTAPAPCYHQKQARWLNFLPLSYNPAKGCSQNVFWKKIQGCKSQYRSWTGYYGWQ